MEGTFKGLALIGASALVAVIVWAVVERGAFIARLGSTPPAFRPLISRPLPLPDPAANTRPLPPPNPVPAPEGTTTIYKWTDAQGGIHFSDRPQDGTSEAITLGQIQTVRMETPVSRPVTVVATTLPKVGHHKKPISADDYHFIKYANQRLGYVNMSGRVEYGPSCDHLQLTVQGTSNHGQSVTGHTVVQGAGSISRLWEVRVRSGWSGGAMPVWEVSRIWAKCLDE